MTRSQAGDIQHNQWEQWAVIHPPVSGASGVLHHTTSVGTAKIRLQTNLSQMKAFLSKVNRQYNNYRVLYAKIISNAQFHAFIFLQFLKKKTRRKIPGKRSLKRALKWSVRCARRVSMTKTRWSNTPCSFTPSMLRVYSVWWCWCRAPTGSTVSRMPTRRQMMIMVSCKIVLYEFDLILISFHLLQTNLEMNLKRRMNWREVQVRWTSSMILADHTSVKCAESHSHKRVSSWFITILLGIWET